MMLLTVTPEGKKRSGLGTHRRVLDRTLGTNTCGHYLPRLVKVVESTTLLGTEALQLLHYQIKRLAFSSSLRSTRTGSFR